jgi:carbonic anhydrase
MNVTLSVNGSDFTEQYTLLQFHFHWGENEYQGSEHFLNGDKYPLEVKNTLN